MVYILDKETPSFGSKLCFYHHVELCLFQLDGDSAVLLEFGEINCLYLQCKLILLEFFYSKDGRSKFLRYVGMDLPNYTVAHQRR
jgi:hypothetical protein